MPERLIWGTTTIRKYIIDVTGTIFTLATFELPPEMTVKKKKRRQIGFNKVTPSYEWSDRWGKRLCEKLLGNETAANFFWKQLTFSQ